MLTGHRWGPSCALLMAGMARGPHLSQKLSSVFPSARYGVAPVSEHLSSWWWPVPGIGHSHWYLTLGWGISYTWSKDVLNSYMSPLVLVVKEPPANAWDKRDVGSIPGLGRSPRGGNGNPLQYFCLENPHGQRSLVGYGTWGCKESDMTEYTQHRERGRQEKMTFLAMRPPPRPHPITDRTWSVFVFFKAWKCTLSLR